MIWRQLIPVAALAIFALIVGGLIFDPVTIETDLLPAPCGAPLGCADCSSTATRGDCPKWCQTWQASDIRRRRLVFAVLRFISCSNFTDCWTGSSASGFFVMRGNHECANIYWG
jgi:hypothetical protein